MNLYLVASAFISRPTFSLTSKTISIFDSVVFMFHPNKVASSA